MLRDLEFRAALVAALFFWLFLYLFQQPVISWLWPLDQPKRFITLVLLYPVLEELIFRGAIQGFLQDYFKQRQFARISLANVVTTLLFSLAHLYFRTIDVALLVIVPSLMFGYFRDKYQSMIPAMLLHVFFNAGYFWLFWG